MQLIYKRACPSCHGPIEVTRLSLGLPCSRCLPHLSNKDLTSSLSDTRTRNKILIEILGEPGDYFFMYTLEEDLGLFERFFEKIIRSGMWSIQRMWSKRLLNLESFALVAPTGVGKSTLLQIYSLYMMNYSDKRIYFILPTKQLAHQTFERLRSFSERIDLDKENIVLYDSSKTDFHEILDLLRSNKKIIFVSTSALLSKKYDYLKDLFFDIVIADDLDAILKSSRNLERVLNMIGYGTEIIEKAYRVSVLTQELIYSKLTNRSDLIEKLREEIELIRSQILSYRASRKTGQLIVATATGRGGAKTKILREVLGFEAGGILEYSRNVIDSYKYLVDRRDLYKILSEIGGGTIIYVPLSSSLKPRDLFRELVDEGFKVGLADSRTSHIKRFLNKEIDYLVASASIYGIATRGLDAPLVIRNAVFINIPSYKISLDKILTDPKKLFIVLRSLRDYYEDLDKEILDLSKIINRLKISELNILRRILRNEIEAREYQKELIASLLRYIDLSKTLLSKLCDKKLVTRIGVVYPCMNYALIPDPMTYIQASGRTSRLLNKRFTLGLSIVLYDDEELLKLFIRKIQRYLINSEFKNFDELDLDKIKRDQERSRSISSSDTGINEIDVKTILMIVESPTKARTISQLFGSRAKKIIGDTIVREFSVATKRGSYVVGVIPSLGHIVELIEDEGFYGIDISRGYPALVYSSIKRCLTCGYQFSSDRDTCPRCGSSKIRDSFKIIDLLRKYAQFYDAIYIATDPDQEGEKIAYDLKNLLTPYNRNIYRIEFHEITREAIIRALENPRDINIRVVESQIIRRVDDRLVGFIMSRELQERFGVKWLGAGRVQTPVLSWVIDSYNRYLSGRGYWVKIYTDYAKDIGVIRIFVRDREEAEKISREKYLEIKRIDKQRRILQPQPPFTTDTLISVANSVMRLSPSVTMRIAQNLFESGLITYHRTDSTHVSDYGIRIAKQFISQSFGEELFRGREWGDEKGAHEAIRPTHPIPSDELLDSMLLGEIPIVKLDDTHKRVYDLIFRRFIASQMREADVEICKIGLFVGGYETTLEGICRVFDEGFLKVYNSYRLIPRELLERGEIEIREVKIQRGSSEKLLTSGEVIKLMKEKAIGRPSTYAKAIENNKRHGYVIESKRLGYLIPTKTGLVVYETIKSLYPSIVSERATRLLEEKLSSIERGEKNAEEALKEILYELRDLDLRSSREQIVKIEEIIASLEKSAREEIYA